MITEKLENKLFIAVNAALAAGDQIMEVYRTGNFEIESKSDDSPLTLADRQAHNKIMEYLSETEIPVLSEEGKYDNYEDRKDRTLFWLVDPLDGTKEFIKKNDEFTVNIALINGDTPIAGIIYLPVLKQLYIGDSKNGAFKNDNIVTTDLSAYNSYPDLLKDSKKLPIKGTERKYTAVGSRSHMSPETEEFMTGLKEKYGEIDIISKGSSLKLCMVAEGKADIYPRFGPTMEWDTGAGDAIVRAMGGSVINTDGTPLVYNKENLLNPFFIVSA